MTDYQKQLGFLSSKHSDQTKELIQYVNLKLAAWGQPIFQNFSDAKFLEMAEPLLENQRQKNRILSNYYCPADQRIMEFLKSYFSDLPKAPQIRLPNNAFVLDRHGIARTLSLPPDKDIFESSIVTTYRVRQGILHNPKNDRRTTQGVFHVSEGGLPIPEDKLAVPKAVFAVMLEKALQPPSELLRIPFTASQAEQAELFVSLLLRPIVSPEVPGFLPEKSLEIRFFAPGNLVGNLDFVESIFGNAGDPYLPENNAALDVEHWTGHTGCVILAPHLVTLKKKDVGLPHYDQATERQRRDGMCWKKPEELYNDGGAFKMTARNAQGVIVTIIADNYFGYCKKEVKTQISFSSNLYGLSEEEHSGGAIAFPSYDLGEEFKADQTIIDASKHHFSDVVKNYGPMLNVYPEGYAVDKNFSEIVYVPEDAHFQLPEQVIDWKVNGKSSQIKMLASHTYLLPNGYKIRMKKQTGSYNWILIGTAAEGTFCHKPCTVSGGGKSEISKSIVDAMIQGPVFISDLEKDFDLVDEILKRDFSKRFLNGKNASPSSRPILSEKRSLGSVIKLLTPSDEFSDEHNRWIKSLPDHIRDLIITVKRFYQPEWKGNWRKHFRVDTINGHEGHELKLGRRKLVANYLRVGRDKEGLWRIYRVRQDFSPAQKVQTEDDITASVVVPSNKLEYLNPDYKDQASVKMSVNCEYRLFQRPDDAIYRGYDKQAEADLSASGVFLSNYEPLNHKQVQEILEDNIGFDLYTDPVKNLIHAFWEERKPDYLVCSSHPRMVNGKPSKNPRYLQNRPDMVEPKHRYLAEVGTRLFRNVPFQKPVHLPVNAVLPGRRNNPPDKKAGIPPLAVYNPIHYQELPELFLDFICSVTGKSPSTTGFGSEGALTKGPFNALWPIVDLNNALVSFIVCGYDGFSSAAGTIGPDYQVDHDISLLIPEIFSRMSVHERNPKYLIEKGYLEKINDFEYKGRKVLGSILGYRMTIKFANAFLGRIFISPSIVFNEEMLRPELQDMDVFVEGIESLVATQKRVAEFYFADGSVEAACPPLKALLHIMAKGHYQGKTINDSEVRNLFNRETLLRSSWYLGRLETRQKREIQLWKHHIEALENFLKNPSGDTGFKLEIQERLEKSKETLKKRISNSYIEDLKGTIGADPFHHQILSPEESFAAIQS